MAKEDPAWPPKPLDDDLMHWLVGEWQGWTEMPFGRFKCWQKCYLDLGGQFLVIEHKSDGPEGTYEGRGFLTRGANDEVLGYWFDNMRSMANGSGTRQGHKLIMKWTDQWLTQERTLERVDEDTILETFSMPDPDGNPLEGKTRLTRVTESGDD